jgi:hypothetical protein
MSSYTERFSSVLLETQARYKKLHNLYLLKGFRQKVNCYRNNPSHPEKYYECFYEVEGEMLKQSGEFVGKCQQIDVPFAVV